MVTFHLILLVTLDKCSWYIDKESATAHQVKTIRNTHLVNKLSLLTCCSMEPGNGEVLVAFGLCGMILERGPGKWRLILDGMLSHMKWEGLSDYMSQLSLFRRQEK